LYSALIMGIYDLLFHARLENATSVFFSPDARWFFLTSCCNCRESNNKEIVVTRSDSVQAPGSRGFFNFTMKCKFCNSLSTLKFSDGTTQAYENSERMEKVECIEARGMKITKWRVADGISVQSESGKVFETVNLEEGDWVEYDEEIGGIVGVYDVNTDIAER
jgi:hypothetical protein